jgi:hypothetical protein
MNPHRAQLGQADDRQTGSLQIAGFEIAQRYAAIRRREDLRLLIRRHGGLQLPLRLRDLPLCGGQCVFGGPGDRQIQRGFRRLHLLLSGLRRLLLGLRLVLRGLHRRIRLGTFLGTRAIQCLLVERLRRIYSLIRRRLLLRSGAALCFD